MSSIQAINSMNIDFVLPINIRKMLTLLSFAERLVLKLQSPMQQMLLMRLSAAKVLVYMLALQDDIAHEVTIKLYHQAINWLITRCVGIAGNVGAGIKSG